MVAGGNVACVQTMKCAPGASASEQRPWGPAARGSVTDPAEMALAGVMSNAFKMAIAVRMSVRNAESATTTVANPIVEENSVGTMDVENPAVFAPEGRPAKMDSAKKRNPRVPPTAVTRNVVMMAVEALAAHAR